MPEKYERPITLEPRTPLLTCMEAVLVLAMLGATLCGAIAYLYTHYFAK